MSDVLILGGGAIGLSLAYELAERGFRVRVLDRGQPGQEASWAGAGIIPASKRLDRDHPYDQLAGLSADLHPLWAEQLREETGIDNGYRRCGGIYLAREPETWHALELAADDWYGRGIEVEQLGGERLQELEPALDCSFKAMGWPKRVLAAYYLPGEAQIRNPRYVRALRSACEQRGVAITSDCELEKFVVQGERLAAIETREGEVSGDVVVIAAGAWTRLLLEKLGVPVRVKPIRGQIVLYRGEQPLLKQVINDGPRYFVPRDDGRILVGSTEEDSGFDKQTTERGIAGLKKFAGHLSPAVAELPIEKTWAGLRPGTADGLPYLGRVPALTNAYVAAGHFRSGLHLSPGTAVVMSQLVRGLKTEIDLTPFRLERG